MSIPSKSSRGSNRFPRAAKQEKITFTDFMERILPPSCHLAGVSTDGVVGEKGFNVRRDCRWDGVVGRGLMWEWEGIVDEKGLSVRWGRKGLSMRKDCQWELTVGGKGSTVRMGWRWEGVVDEKLSVRRGCREKGLTVKRGCQWERAVSENGIVGVFNVLLERGYSLWLNFVWRVLWIQIGKYFKVT